MHGLTELEHHKVGHIHHGIDTAQTRAAQSFFQPHGTGPGYVDVTNHPAQISRATGWVFQIHGKGEIVRGFNGHHVRAFDGLVVEHTDFPGEPTDTETISAIGRQIEIDNQIVEQQRFSEVDARLQVLSKIENSVFILTESQLRRAAEHAVGFHVAKIRLLDLEVTRQHRANPGKR